MDPAALSAAARFVQFVGAVVLFGAPLLAQTGFRGVGGAAALRLAWPNGALRLAALLVIVGAAGSLSVQTAGMTGQPADALRPAALWAVLSGTRFGGGLAARAALAATVLCVGGSLTASGRRAVVIGLGAGLLASFAWTGHGAMDDGGAGLIHRLADILHLLAAGAWVGALALFAACLGSSALRGNPSAIEGLTHALRRFSGTGSICVAALVATGLVNSLFLVGLNHLGEAASTPYGQALIVKLALFAGMILLAALNRFLLAPRLEARGQLAGLRWSIGVETLLALVVLGVVAWLGILPPPTMT
jgi:putative copper resistance protein D